MGRSCNNCQHGNWKASNVPCKACVLFSEYLPRRVPASVRVQKGLDAARACSSN